LSTKQNHGCKLHLFKMYKVSDILRSLKITRPEFAKRNSCIQADSTFATKFKSMVVQVTPKQGWKCWYRVSGCFLQE